MQKFKITHDSITTEFATFDDAELYKTEKNLTEEIIPFEEEIGNGMYEAVFNKILQYERLAPTLIRELKTSNTLGGITTEQSDQMFDEFADVLLRIKEGAFPTAVYRLQNKEPSGFVTQELIDLWIQKIINYMN